MCEVALPVGWLRLGVGVIGFNTSKHGLSAKHHSVRIATMGLVVEGHSYSSLNPSAVEYTYVSTPRDAKSSVVAIIAKPIEEKDPKHRVYGGRYQAPEQLCAFAHMLGYEDKARYQYLPSVHSVTIRQASLATLTGVSGLGDNTTGSYAKVIPKPATSSPTFALSTNPAFVPEPALLLAAGADVLVPVAVPETVEVELPATTCDTIRDKIRAYRVMAYVNHRTVGSRLMRYFAPQRCISLKHMSSQPRGLRRVVKALHQALRDVWHLSRSTKSESESRGDCKSQVLHGELRIVGFNATVPKQQITFFGSEVNPSVSVRYKFSHLARPENSNEGAGVAEFSVEPANKGSLFSRRVAIGYRWVGFGVTPQPWATRDYCANLTLYSTTAFIILDTDGNRVLGKYYKPRHAPLLGSDTGGKSFSTLKEQRAFEKGLLEKTKKPGGEIILYEGYLAVYKHSLDVIFYVISPASENELMTHSALVGFTDALSLLLRGQVEKRAILENLDLTLLALDETIDDGIIIETEGPVIASRVSRPRADVSEIVINEQTIMSALHTVRDRVQQRMGTF
ncbi:clathrin adaptor complex small chain domain-containing protein [Rhizoctonia solani AG-1 IA]|uniref:Zeta-coat protein n=1 Tax=Thanatephorus cucumeris (strain AG1-IA) TaxID=983506 RepID=L8WVM0_THACA|nr:clathrin adaptor complex small chain domain-containing protein [Rhizoctonia solani AG-1 IA]